MNQEASDAIMTDTSNEAWTIQYRVFRFKRGDARPHFETFSIQIDPHETVLDGLEKIWAFQDRSLAYRHACHHASCGSCGIRVNGVEKLPCIVPIREVTHDGGTLLCEPLRNFPLVSDLVVDMGQFYRRFEETQFQIIRTAEPLSHDGHTKQMPYARFENCIECGLCVSACPVAGTDELYLGPAALAASWRMLEDPRETNPSSVRSHADQEHGCWRCHVAFECSEVCPSNVDPAAAIMTLRQDLLKRKLRRLFRRGDDD
jgi:succinate dehydrogenase / fumarate reductase iron-sulfur subunit